nr:hypothetical protein [Tanacetum cinerariifolium]
MVFHKIKTEEISDRFVAPCFINGLEAYDGEINLKVEENMSSNKFGVKLGLDHEVKRRNKVVKKELIVALRREIYFVKFIINPKEDDVEPGVVFGRSFLCLTKAIDDFGNETITIYLELDPFFVSSEEEEKTDDDWDLLLDDLDFGDIPDIKGVNVSQFVCKMGKSEEAERDALAISICEIYSLLEEERHVIETMAYSGKYKKILYGICLDKIKPDGMNKEEEESITMGGNDDEAESSRPKCSRQYKTVEEVLLLQVHHEFLEWEGCNRDAKSRVGHGKEIDGFLRINFCEAGTNEEKITFVAWIRPFNINKSIYSELCHKFYSTYEFNEEGFDVHFQGGLLSDEHFNAHEYWLSINLDENLILSRSHASTIRNPVLRVLHKMITYGLCQRTTGWIKRKGVGTQRESLICCRQFTIKLARKARVLSYEVLRSLSALIYCRDLDTTTTLRELIDSKGRLILEAPELDVPRVAIPRAWGASM